MYQDIVIRNIQKPTDCGSCDFLGRNSYGTFFCLAIMCVCKNRKQRSIFKDIDELRHEAGIRANCPLVPLPEKHGRLIDADALIADCVFPSKQFEDAFRELLGDAPTIVPAEGGTEDA